MYPLTRRDGTRNMQHATRQKSRIETTDYGQLTQTGHRAGAPGYRLRAGIRHAQCAELLLGCRCDFSYASDVRRYPKHSMSKRRHLSLGLLLAVGITGLLEAQTSRNVQRQRAKTLRDTIENVSLTDGFESIGGASIEDAANLLRDNAGFPVALEMVEFERP